MRPQGWRTPVTGLLRICECWKLDATVVKNVVAFAELELSHPQPFAVSVGA